MKEALKRVKIEFIIEAIIIIAIGIVFIGWAPAVIPVMARVLAVLLIIIGVVFVGAFIFKKIRTPFDSGLFVAGIIIAAVGAWIFLYPSNFTNLIPKIFGVFVLLSGIRNLGQTITLIRSHYGFWWISLILAIITLALGGWLVVKSQEATELVVRIIGCSLIYDGASNLWTMSRIKKFSKAVGQEIRDMEAVDTTAEIRDSDSAER